MCHGDGRATAIVSLGRVGAPRRAACRHRRASAVAGGVATTRAVDTDRAPRRAAARRAHRARRAQRARSRTQLRRRARQRAQRRARALGPALRGARGQRDGHRRAHHGAVGRAGSCPGPPRVRAPDRRPDQGALRAAARPTVGGATCRPPSSRACSLREGADVSGVPALADTLREPTSVFAGTATPIATFAGRRGFFVVQGARFGRGPGSNGFLAVFVPSGWLSLSLAEDVRAPRHQPRRTPARRRARHRAGRRRELRGPDAALARRRRPGAGHRGAGGDAVDRCPLAVCDGAHRVPRRSRGRAAAPRRAAGRRPLRALARPALRRGARRLVQARQPRLRADAGLHRPRAALAPVAGFRAPRRPRDDAGRDPGARARRRPGPLREPLSCGPTESSAGCSGRRGRSPSAASSTPPRATSRTTGCSPTSRRHCAAWRPSSPRVATPPSCSRPSRSRSVSCSTRTRPGCCATRMTGRRPWSPAMASPIPRWTSMPA